MRKSVCEESVLASMCVGTRYTSDMLAHLFNTTKLEMRRALGRMADQGVITLEVRGRAYVYAKTKTFSAGLPPMTPLKTSREMQAVIERTKELRVYESKF